MLASWARPILVWWHLPGVVAYFGLLTDLGVPLSGTQQIARDRTKIAEGYVTDVLGLRLLLAFISLTLLLLLVLVIPRTRDVKILLLLFGITLLPGAAIIDWVFQGLEEMHYTALSRTLDLIYVALLFALVRNSDGLLRIPVLQTVAGTISALILLAVYIRRFGVGPLSFKFASWKRIFHHALPLGISMVMIQVMYSIDTVLLGFLRTDAEVGYYNAAYKIILFVISVGAVYFDAIFPLASNYYEQSLESLKRLQRHTANFVVSLACPMALGGVVLGGPIMRLFYGPRYDSGIIAFQILILAAAFIYLNMIYARGMWACNLQQPFVRIVTLQAVLNVVLNLVLIPRYGIAGAATSTVISEFCGLYFYYKEFNRIVRVEFYDFLFRPMMAAALMSLILLLFPDFNLFLRLVGGFLVYFGLLCALKGVTSEDVRLLKAVLPMKNG